jgi:hypothetical protein
MTGTAASRRSLTIHPNGSTRSHLVKPSSGTFSLGDAEATGDILEALWERSQQGVGAHPGRPGARQWP